MSANTMESNVVPLFRTFTELQHDQHQIMSDYFADWERAYEIWDIAKAAMDGDASALAKFTQSDSAHVALAKSEAHRSKTLYGDLAVAESRALAKLVASLKAAVDKRNDRLFGHTALARRSMRFAMAQERRNYGPGATSLPPAS